MNYMLKVKPSEAVRIEIRERCRETMSLEGAGLEMIEREMARRELGLEEIDEFKRALAVYGFLTNGMFIK